MFGEASSKAANQRLVKQMNKALLRNLIYSTGLVSRSQLAKKTNMSPTTVSTLVAELIHNNMVVEAGAVGRGSSGRKPIMLKIKSDGGYVVSFEMMEAMFSCNIYDLECKPVYETQTDLPAYADAAGKMVRVIEKASVDAGVPAVKLLGIVIGVPALIDRENKRIITSTVIPLSDDVDLVRQIRDNYPDVPIILENSSCLYAYAERSFGSNRDVNELIFIDIGVGIGSGIIIGGGLFSGSSGFAGEIGHMSIDPNGPVCKCGNKGCFEIMASVPAIKREIITALISGRRTMMDDYINGDFNNITLDMIRNALDCKDALACEIAEEISGRIATGINNVINFFDPKAVVIGGEILKLGHFFRDRIIERIDRIKMRPVPGKPDVVFTDLQKDPVCLGGAKYVLDLFFRGSIV